MTHPEAERLYDAYFQGTLDRAATRDLHAHFKDCEQCRSRIRLRRAAAPTRDAVEARGLSSPETQRQIARNRDLLIKILLLGVAAWAVFKWKK
ncbi:MAG TPA: hypothetical protein VNZ54_03885 [bacterium]|jgi:hypothetical protein|nr:hypothetical protein [bacterium]